MNNIKFERISLEKGLSQSVVYCILQDCDGFIWFGTQEGLNRYDGNKFKVYKKEEDNDYSLYDNYIYSGFEDRAGTLWFGSLYGGLIMYDKVNDGFINYDLRSEESENEINMIVTSICEDEEQNLWIGSFGGGLKKFNKKNKKVKHYNRYFEEQGYSNCNNIPFINFSYKGFLQICTWGDGLFKFDVRKEKFQRYEAEHNETDMLLNSFVRCIYEDKNKNIWLGTSEGLIRMDNKNLIAQHFCQNNEIPDGLSYNFITAICEEDSGNLWIGTRNGGVNYFDTVTHTFRTYKLDEKNAFSLSNNSVVSLYKDKSNVIWIGTLGGGLNKIDGKKKKFYIFENCTGTENNVNIKNVDSILKDSSNTIWIGSHSDGLFRQKTKSEQVENYHQAFKGKKFLSGGSIFSIYEDNNSDIWVATLEGGISKFDKEREEFETYKYEAESTNNRIYFICGNEENRNELLLGTANRGILKFNLESKKFHSLLNENIVYKYLENNIIRKIIFDSEGNLLVATSKNGLLKISPDYKKVIQYRHEKNNPDSIGDNSILTIYEDSSKNLWAGTYGAGLCKYIKLKNIFKSYTVKNGLPNNIVIGILEDEDRNLWLSTNNGLSKFDTEKEIFRNYDENDGLQSSEFNSGAYFKDDEKIFYFGGINGLNYFNPNEIEDNSEIPNTVITDFQIFNHPIKNSGDNPFLKENISLAKDITMSYEESVFSFEFSSLIYNNPIKNQFAYMMEGFDREWIYCGNRRFATYTNLPPGDYMFKVKASNNDGIWNEEGTSINVKISPPYWKKWWFKSLGVFSILGAAGVAYSKKLSVIENEKRTQDEFSRRLLDSQEQERKNIATELHHTIAHDVLITKNKAFMGLRCVENPQEVKKVLNEISDLAINTLNDVRSISYNLHPHQIERLGITKAIRSIVNRTSNSSDIEFSTDLEDIDNVLSKELEINVFRIIQECMNNILKHSSASRSELKIMKIDNSVMIIISDNGKGFLQTRNEGLGMMDINERVRLYKGSFNIESVTGKGTILHILLPIK